jgi:hypothetical protein
VTFVPAQWAKGKKVNVNAVMDAFIGDGETDTIIIPPGFVVGRNDQFIFRKSTSDGAITPQEADYDTALTGGNLSYSTATGLRAEDIIVDGDGFVTPTSSPATEEVVPGHIFDTVAIKVYDKPTAGSASIKVVNYVGNGTDRNFSIGQLINSAQAVIVKITDGNTSLIQTIGDDFNVNYPEQRVEFDIAPETNQIVSIYSFGFGGSNILDLDYFIGTGTISEFVSKAPWASNITALVYINGIPEEVELFKTDDTYENSNRVGIRFNMPPNTGDVINFVIVSGNEQTFSITKTERIATDGRLASVPYNLTNKVGNSQPAESNIIVRVNQEILSAPSNSYFTIKGNKLTYLIDNNAFPPYSLQISDIIVYVGNKTLSLGTDYIVDLSVISVKITNTVRSTYNGQQLVVSIVPNRLTVGQSYTYLPGVDNTAPQIRFSEVYSNTDVVEVISSYKHDILDIQRTAVTVTSTVQLTPSTLEYYNYVGTTGGYINLNRSVINESYVWVTKNNKLLIPSIDFKLNSDRQSIKLTEYPEENDLISVITYSSDILTDGIAYMQFKDMLNRVHYKRLSANKQTRLVNDLNYNDTTIELVDASNFDIPNISTNRPGIVEIRGERIEFFAISGNTLKQIRRGTLGTGIYTHNKAGTFVQDIGTSSTVPYADSTTVQNIIADGVSSSYAITLGATLNSSFTNYNSLFEVFVGGDNDTVRLKKSSFSVFDVNRAPYSPLGDVIFPAEFTISNVTTNGALLTLTNPVTQGTKITVVRVTGHEWDGNKNNPVNILDSDGAIASFIKATPGIWYSGFNK